MRNKRSFDRISIMLMSIRRFRLVHNAALSMPDTLSIAPLGMKRLQYALIVKTKHHFQDSQAPCDWIIYWDSCLMAGTFTFGFITFDRKKRRKISINQYLHKHIRIRVYAYMSDMVMACNISSFASSSYVRLDWIGWYQLWFVQISLKHLQRNAVVASN